MEAVKEKKAGFKKSKAGWIPNDWHVGTFGDLISNVDSGVSVNGEDRPAKKNENGVLKTSAVFMGKFLPNNNKVITVEKELQRAKINPKKNTLIICRANSPEYVGMAAFIDSDYNNLFLSDKLWLLELKPNIDGKWVNLLLMLNKFRFIIMNRATGTSNSMKNISKGSYLSIPVPIPNFEEQQKISQIINTWSIAISDTEKLLENLKLRLDGFKQVLLFGKKRLKGFNQPWNAHKAKDFLQPRKSYEINDGTYPLYSLTIEDGVTPKSDRYIREFLVKDVNKKYKVIHPNDIVFNPSNLRWGAIAKHNGDNKVILSPIYEVLQVKKGFDMDFISFLVSSPRQIAFYATKVEGTLVERMAVKLDAFLLIEYNLPVLEEQIAIGKLLKTAQSEIDFYSKKLKKLENQKTGLMQQLLTGQKRVKV